MFTYFIMIFFALLSVVLAGVAGVAIGRLIGQALFVMEKQAWGRFA